MYFISYVKLKKQTYSKRNTVMTTKDSKTNCPVNTIAAIKILGTSTLTPIHFVSIFVCVISQLSNSVTGQECLSQVLLGLLDVVLSGLSQRVTQCLTFEKIRLKDLSKKPLCSAHLCLATPACIWQLRYAASLNGPGFSMQL